MKAQFIDKLLSQPWHIGQTRGRTIIGHVLQCLLRDERPSKDIDGDPLPKTKVVGNIAIVPIFGVLMLNVPDWIKAWGFNLTDANDIAEEIDEVLADPAVTMIVLDIDSPGGESIAGQKLFDVMEAANRKKPVFAFSGDGSLLCSAAYHCAAPAVAIITGKFAEIGSIGTFMSHVDDSEYWESLGIKWEVFRSGAFKGMGIDKLTEEQRAYLQNSVDKFGGLFRSNVAKYRPGIDPADMEGQSFMGSEAAGKGFIGGLAKDLGAAVSKFQKLI